MTRQILTIANEPAFKNPLAEMIRDFESSFFNLNNMIDWTADVPILKNHIIDTTGFPRANVKNVSTKEADMLEFTLALPGWSKDNSKLDITIDDAILTIKGNIEEKDAEKPENASEHYGKEYERNISLKKSFIWQHSVTEDAEFDSATLKDGLLRVVVKVPLPKKPEPKRITID